MKYPQRTQFHIWFKLSGFIPLFLTQFLLWNINGCGTDTNQEEKTEGTLAETLVKLKSSITEINSESITIEPLREDEQRAESNDPLVPCSISLSDFKYAYEVVDTEPRTLIIESDSGRKEFVWHSPLPNAMMSDYDNLLGRWALPEQIDSVNNVSFQVFLEIDGLFFQLINKCKA